MKRAEADLNCFTPVTVRRTPTASGPLDGVRIAVKDLISFAGHTASFGHARWRETHEQAASDAPVVSALLAAGGEIIGTTKMDQLAYSLIGDVGEGAPPLNVFDPDSYCGGSSSGSASAVAGGVADLGVGTDTAGSVRVPAAACGLFSIRPTHGAIDTTGVAPLAPSFDVLGLFARAPEVLATALGVLNVSPAPGSPLRILLPNDVWAAQESTTREVARAAATRLGERLDATVDEVDFSGLVSAEAGDLLARLQSREIWAEHSAWVSKNSSALASDVRTRLERCAQLSADPAEVKDADIDAHGAYRDRLGELIPAGSVAIVPVRPRPGPRRDWTETELLEFRRDAFRLAAPSTLGGIPQVVAPTVTESHYVPLGLIGAKNSDLMLLEAANLFDNLREEAHP